MYMYMYVYRRERIEYTTTTYQIDCASKHNWAIVERAEIADLRQLVRLPAIDSSWFGLDQFGADDGEVVVEASAQPPKVAVD